MIKAIRFQNFKSWQDTKTVRFAPITGLFGTNSSGKTSLLQFLLMQKQTIESVDRSRVLYTGDDRSYVDLGTFYDLIYKHEVPGHIQFAINWDLPKLLRIVNPEHPSETLFRIRTMNFSARIEGTGDRVQVEQFFYRFDHNKYKFGMQRQAEQTSTTKNNYELIFKGYELKRNRGRAWSLPAPVKSYGFPDQVNAYYQNAGFLSELVLAFEELFQNMHYLGPLREYPSRSYVWSGERPQDVGPRGQLAIPALLAAEASGEKIGRGKGRPRQSIQERVATWLIDLGLIHSFSLKPIAPNRKEYEVRVRRSVRSAEVFITDVGFGVSQILPVLVLCYYAPQGSTIILEQPEIHLHPSVQAGLADVFIDAITHRDIQIILESHSEHLLHRLQRRIAEEKLKFKDAALYFTTSANGKSKLEELDLDPYGNITNWPKNFFGDELGDLAAMTEAAMHRKQAETE